LGHDGLSRKLRWLTYPEIHQHGLLLGRLEFSLSVFKIFGISEADLKQLDIFNLQGGVLVGINLLSSQVIVHEKFHECAF